tara:strand:+ start:405 stop:1133 length:729 start_codon:yes stop_codon:yes gene_type:complete
MNKLFPIVLALVFFSCDNDLVSTYDECGVLNGDNSSCTDDCGNVNGDNSTCVTDIDGNIYNSVWIGYQLWMQQNLKVTRYQNGDEIPYYCCTDSIGAYYHYNNDSSIASDDYGNLYNGIAANDSRNVCPEGWRVPNIEEVYDLISYVSGDGGALKKEGYTYWDTPNTGASNSTGFSAVGAGRADPPQYGGDGYNLNESTRFWTTSSSLQNYHQTFRLNKSSTHTNIGGNRNHTAFSVRCIKD